MVEKIMEANGRKGEYGKMRKVVRLGISRPGRKGNNGWKLKFQTFNKTQIENK